MWPFKRPDTNERPEKPEPEDKSKSYDLTRYEATIEYRNGDTETFECYGVSNRGDHYITFHTGPYGHTTYNRTVTNSFDRRSENYETLAREPILEELATDTFTLTWTEDYVWERPRHSSYDSDEEWCAKPADVELSIERDTGGGDG